MDRSRRWLLPTAVLCLLLSGAAGLVYQVVWMRYLALFLGHTSYAVVAVLISFMGGLALGNAWLGARADRTARPLALYAWLEIGIGLYAILFPTYYDWIHRAYLSLASGLPSGGAAAFSLKFLFSLLTILLPTTLMGGTLPILTRLVTRSLGELRERVANLYFVNSAGAVGGCFLADFWWIPALGLEATVLAGAGMNLVVGILALLVNARLGGDELTADEPPAPATPKAEEETYTRGEWRLAVIGAGISGFVAMLYEVVWTRMLGLALGSSTHAFSIMLITFITGIAAGAWIVMRWRRLRRTLDAFGWAELALALALALSVWFYARVPFWFASIASLLARQPQAYPLYELAQALICFLVMFIPTLCLGMTLPLASRVATSDIAKTGRSVGTVFAVNTLGTVLGAALTGLWLLPHLGLAATFFFGIALNAALGLFTVRRHWCFAHLRLSAAGALLLVLGALAGSQLLSPLWQKASTLAVWRREVPPPSYEAYLEAARSVQLPYYRDGAGSTVSIDTYTAGGRDYLTLRVNGKPDAGTGVDMPTQMLTGHVPMLLHPRPNHVLVVGLGSGITAGAVTQHPELEQLDLVEISPEVIEAARWFASENHQIHQHPKARFHVEDAKAFLKMTRQRYDVIISEPSNPWLAGVAGVFSREYYESCRDRLQPGGIMAQWVQAYETNDEVLTTVLHTFLSAFPYASVWQTTEADLMLVGTTEPLAVDLERLQQRFVQPNIKTDMERIDLFRLPVLLARQLIPPEDTRHLVPPVGRIHSDYYPILEYMAQRAFFVRSGATLYTKFDQNLSPRPTTLLGQYLQSHPLGEADFRALALFQLAHHLPNDRLFRSIVLQWQTAQPESLEPHTYLNKTQLAGSHSAREAANLQPLRARILQEAATAPEPLRDYASLLYQAYVHQRSAFHLPPTAELETALQRLAEVDPTRRATCQLMLAELAWDRGDDPTCFQTVQTVFASLPRLPEDQKPDSMVAATVLTRCIDSLVRQQRYAEAAQLCQLAATLDYLGPPLSPRHPLLEMLCRRVSEALERTKPASTPAGTP